MKLGPVHLLYGVLLAAVLWWLAGWLGGEERRIRRELGRLEELLEKEGEESAVRAADRARRLGELFDDSFEIDLGAYGGTLRDRGGLARVALSYRGRYDRIEVRFREEELMLDPSGRSARLQLAAHLSGRRGAAPARESYRLALTYTREEGRWRIETARLLEVLEGPGWR